MYTEAYIMYVLTNLSSKKLARLLSLSSKCRMLYKKYSKMFDVYLSHPTVREMEVLKNAGNIKLYDASNIVMLDVGKCKKLWIDIPPNMVSCENFTELKELSLGSCSIKDDDLKYLSKLEVLSLFDCNNIYGTGLKHLVNPKYVNIIDCANFYETRYLKNVYQVCVDYCSKITDKSLEHFTNTYGLSLAKTNITDDGLKYLTKIHKLNLYGCKNIVGSGFVHLKNIISIDLDKCSNIEDKYMMHLKNVKYLNISYCKNITDKTMQHLIDVESLLIADNQISKITISKMNKLSYIKISGTKPISKNMLRSISRVKYVDFSGSTYICDKDIIRLNNVKIVNISRCKHLTKKCLAYLSNADMIYIYDTNINISKMPNKSKYYDHPYTEIMLHAHIPYM